VAAADEPDPSERARLLMARLNGHGGGALVPEVIPLAVRTIALDPGHGGRDGGTSLGFGLLEKDLVKDIAFRLRQLLEQAGSSVVLTREGDETVSLRERAAIATRAEADVFVSIHINWLPDRTARGVETYYLGPTDDPFLRRLAAAENQDSGYSMADYRHLLEGVWADVRQVESRRLAQGVQHALYQTLRKDNPHIVSRGVMTAPFVVLVATEMPAILVEVACLSNEREARLLAIPSYRQRIAEALFTGLWSYADSVSRATIAPETEPEKGS
jgi:N-acetylmuramoyl-L-alanine amidase